MIPMYQLPEALRLTDKQILNAISWKVGINSDISRADNYYRGRNLKILSGDNRHKISVPYGRKLIKSVLGFMFKEGLITYSWPDDWGSFQTVMERIFNYNHESTENRRLAKDQTLYGAAYEALFVDNDEAVPQFYRIPTYQVIPIYTYGIKPKMWAAINFWKVQKNNYVEIYYKDRIRTRGSVMEAQPLLLYYCRATPCEFALSRGHGGARRQLPQAHCATSPQAMRKPLPLLTCRSRGYTGQLRKRLHQKNFISGNSAR